MGFYTVSKSPKESLLGYLYEYSVIEYEGKIDSALITYFDDNFETMEVIP